MTFMTYRQKKPEFAKVKPGDTVLIGEDEIARVLSFISVTRDPDAPTIFQATNVDIVKIHWVHAEEFQAILSARNS